ncbi:YueH family protein [Bacillus sp. CGMCC 1.16541]|uniref:YueH family protein n=1 Tax=Bacillus sp. CGMCC 1.16541 TaxID=2185143 RepID=UPI000D729FE3|nr:YueH family protein [Bacillus sp. CGMCC 1.16541]
MKIRKANIRLEDKWIEQVFVHENKKEEYTLIAIPDIEWATVISYEEDMDTCKDRLVSSLSKRVSEETAIELTNKINFWVREM